MTDFAPEQAQYTKKNTGLLRLIRAVGHSSAGLRYAVRHEAAIRQEIGLLVAGFIAVTTMDVSRIESILLMGSLILVFIVELLNSSIEAVVDRIGVEYHVLSGAAKDMGSAAVLISIVFAAAVWVSILL